MRNRLLSDAFSHKAFDLEETMHLLKGLTLEP